MDEEKNKTISPKIKRVGETVIDTITESKIYKICQSIKESIMMSCFLL